MNTKIKVFMILFLSVLLLIASGCSSKPSSVDKEAGSQEKQGGQTNSGTDNAKSDTSGTPKKGGELVLGYNTDISNFDPILGNSGSDHSLLYPVYDTLIDFNNNLEPQPGLAKSWESPDVKTIVLHLQEGVKFQDGTPFDAEAVKFNLERANSQESRVSDLQNVESVEVVDPLTVKLHLKKPDSSIILALSDRTGMMVSPTAVKKYGKDFSQNPVGAGPFKMVKWEHNSEVQYEAFDGYWKKGQPYLDKMTAKIMPDENARLNALKSGQIGFAFPVTPSNIPAMEKDPNLALKSSQQVAFYMMYLNTTKPPFDNPKVRQALEYAINREALVQAVTFGKGEPAYQPFPKGYWPYGSGLTIPYDPDKAKQLLKESGVGDVTFDMVYFPSGTYGRLAEALRGQLEVVGIRMNLQGMELTKGVSEFFQEKRYPAAFYRWTGRPDPQMTISLLFSKEGYYNTGKTTSSELEALISKAAATYDQRERAKLYGEISQKAILDEAIIVPILFEPSTAVMSPKVKGYEANLIGKPKFASLWLDQ